MNEEQFNGILDILERKYESEDYTNVFEHGQHEGKLWALHDVRRLMAMMKADRV